MQRTQKDLNPRIRRAKVDSLDLYEITEDELMALEHGSPESLYLNFSIFLISIAMSFLISLLTTKIESNRLYDIFVIITVIGFVIGTILFILWLREYLSSSSISQKIRKRMKDEITNEHLKETVLDPNSTLGDVNKT